MKINKKEESTNKQLILMWGQSGILVCYLTMPGDGAYCHWFS